MKSILIALIALLTFGWAAQAVASAEMPMFYRTGQHDGRGNFVVARLIQDSLDRDRDGNAYIQGTPCLTPKILLDTINHYQPDVQVRHVKDLPDLYRTLIPHKARAEGFTGPQTMSRMVCARPGSHQPGDHFDPVGWSREFRADEYAYFLPNHTEPFSAEDCTNIPLVEKHLPPPPPLPPQIPPAQPPIPDCVTIRVPANYLPARTTKVRHDYEIVGHHGLAPSFCLVKGHICHMCTFDKAESEDGVGVYVYHDRRAHVFAPGPGHDFMEIEVSPEVKSGGFHFKDCSEIQLEDGTVLYSTTTEDINFDQFPSRLHFQTAPFVYTTVRPQR